MKINRQISPQIPHWVRIWEFPEFERVGPQFVDLRHLEGFPSMVLRPQQPLYGYELLDFLIKTKLLNHGLNLQVGQTVASRIETVDILGETRIYLWQSVARGFCENLFVPYVQVLRGQLPIVYYWWLGYQINLDRSLGFIKAL
jgi:hypothetical protein